MNPKTLLPALVLAAGITIPTCGAEVHHNRLVTAASFDTATWTGAAGDGDPANAANWQDGKLPDANTVALVSGSSLPTEPFTCSHMALTADVALSANCDWSLSSPIYPNAHTIDLKGKELKISSPWIVDGTTIADSTTDTANPGKLVVDVAPNVTLENATVVLSGNLQLVKEGAGTFIGKVKNQSYTGGTVVNEGSIEVTGSESVSGLYFGPLNKTVTVNPDGILNVKRNYSWNCYSIILNGGTINNTTANYRDSAQGLGDITLTDDSKMTVEYHTTFKQNDRDGVVNLGGHALSFEYVTNPGDDKAILHFNGSIVTNGTMVFGEKTQFNPLKATNIGGNVTMVMNGDFFLENADVTVLNFEDASMGHSQTLRNSRRVHVAGRYTPNSEYLVNVTLKNGATLDLTKKTQAWEFVNALTPQTLAFEDGATITIDVSGRNLTKGEQIVAWSEKPANVTFQWDATTAAKGTEISVIENGIFYGQVVATAHWTNTLGDGDMTNPENWACTNASDVAVSAVPTNVTTVYFAGDAITAQITDPVFWRVLNVNGKLGADCDWSGLGETPVAEGSFIDLNGRTLTSSGFAADGAFVVTNAVEAIGTLVFDIANGTAWSNATVSIQGNLKVVKNGAGALVGKRSSQLYTGGTVINQGSISIMDAESETGLFFGSRDTSVTVNPDGILDIKRNYSWCRHKIILNGGAIKNAAADYADTAQGLGDVELTADSKMLIGYDTTFRQNDRNGVVDLGGHTLSVSYVDTGLTDTQAILYLDNTTWKNGTVVFHPSTVLCVYPAAVLEDTLAVVIKGTYKPLGPCLHNTKLTDGATLDLTEQTDTWAFACGDGSNQALTFAENATIMVDVSGRPVAAGDKIITWSEAPNATFVFKGADGLKPEVAKDGLYARLASAMFMIAGCR